MEERYNSLKLPQSVILLNSYKVHQRKAARQGLRDNHNPTGSILLATALLDVTGMGPKRIFKIPRVMDSYLQDEGF